MTQPPLEYRPPIDRTRRSAGKWILLLLVWAIGLCVWAGYAALSFILLLRVFS